MEWIRFPKKILDSSNAPFHRWFPDGQLNVCHNCVDRHAAIDPTRRALVWVSNMVGKEKTISYQELLELVCKMARILQQKQVGKGDRVIIFMPMLPLAVVCMLACARIGAVHSLVFGGFAARELANRIEDSRAKLLLTASCGIEPHKTVDYIRIVKDALGFAPGEAQPQVLVYQRPEHPVAVPPTFELFDPELVEYGFVPCEPTESGHPLYILYTSGTTGRPKGIVRDHGGTAVAALWTMRHNVGLGAGELFFCSSDLGWVVGHTFGVYGPLLSGAGSIVFEGKPTYPTAGALWAIVDKHRPMGLYTAPTALRAIRKEDPEGLLAAKLDLSTLRTVCLAGERCDITTYEWVSRLCKGALINDHYWQTEAGWIISSNYQNLHTFPCKPGSAIKPAPGFRVEILSGDNQPVPLGELGKICIRLPMPPSFMLTIYNNDPEFLQKYISPAPGYYTTGDAGYFDKDGYLNVMTRLDDIINTAGHRISTAALEEVLIASGQVIEAAVVAKIDEIKGETPVAFIVPRPGL